MSDPTHGLDLDSALGDATVGVPPPLGNAVLAALRNRRREVFRRRAFAGLAAAGALALGVLVGRGAFSHPDLHGQAQTVSIDRRVPVPQVRPIPAALAQTSVAAYLPFTTASGGELPFPADDGGLGGAEPTAPIRPSQAGELLQGL